MNADDTVEKMKRNWTIFRQLCSKLGTRTNAVAAMLDHFEERLVMTPASTRLSYHGAFPGGLVDHSIRVFTNAKKLVKTFEYDISDESLIISCLFHDLGKVGNLDEDYYLEQESDWHREKLGKMYETNKSIPFMTTAQRGLWILQHFNVQLTEDEYLAILLNDGQYADENSVYGMKEGLLATIVHQADRLATEMEKGKTEL